MSIVKEIDKISGTDTRSKNIEDAVKKLELGGGSGGGVFAVNITYDSSTRTYSSDKTYNEIVEALGDGQLCVAYYGNTILYLVVHTDGHVCFSSIYKEAPIPGETSDTVLTSIYINNDNSVIFA